MSGARDPPLWHIKLFANAFLRDPPQVQLPLCALARGRPQPGEPRLFALAALRGDVPPLAERFDRPSLNAPRNPSPDPQGLAHSGEGSQEYADQSGLMGYSYNNLEGPRMCFSECPDEGGSPSFR